MKRRERQDILLFFFGGQEIRMSDLFAEARTVTESATWTSVCVHKMGERHPGCRGTLHLDGRRSPFTVSQIL